MKKIVLTFLILTSLNLNCAENNQNGNYNEGMLVGGGFFTGYGIYKLIDILTLKSFSNKCNSDCNPNLCNSINSSINSSAFVGILWTSLGIMWCVLAKRRRNQQANVVVLPPAQDDIEQQIVRGQPQPAPANQAQPANQRPADENA